MVTIVINDNKSILIKLFLCVILQRKNQTFSYLAVSTHYFIIKSYVELFFYVISLTVGFWLMYMFIFTVPKE